MISLSSISSSTTITTKRLISASAQPKPTTSVDVPPSPSAGVPRIRKNTANNNLQSTTKPKQPSVAEMERAIGAGMFRDRDSRGSGEKPTLFDFLSDTPMAQPESPLEKKLRETGEWVLEATEGGPSRPRSAGHEILMVVCLWILPVWMMSMSVAFGLVKLPFSIPGLDDLLM